MSWQLLSCSLLLSILHLGTSKLALANPVQNSVATQQEQQKYISKLEVDITRLTSELQRQLKTNAKLQSQADSLTENVPCLSEICVKSAASLLRNMDQTTDPCDDFYQYACGGFVKDEHIPDDESSTGYFVKIQRDLDAKLRELLERPVGESELMSIKNARNLYQSCMNEDLISKVSLSAFKRFCEEAGGWPLLSENYNRNWIQVVNNLAKYDFHPLIDLMVDVDNRNSSQRMLKFDETTLGMPAKDYILEGFNSTYVSVYYDYVVSAMTALSQMSDDVVRKVAKKVVKFEIELAKITSSELEKRNITERYNKLTLKEMNELIPGVDWVWYVQRLVGSDVITSSEPVLNSAMDYYRGLMALVNKTDPETVLNYIFWRVFKNQMNNLPKWIRVFQDRFQKIVFGVDTVEARWRTCTTFVQDELSFVLGRMYVDNYFNSKAISDLSDMVKHLKKAFEELILRNKWMDARTKEVAIDKARNIGEAIGYPDWILDDKSLNAMYGEYNFDPKTNFDNVMQLKKSSARSSFQSLRTRTSKAAWSSSPSEINAYYSAPKNKITFPAAILQPPFYHFNYSRSLNYGAIGSVIGHEITHGFDNNGRRYDKHGDLRQWWSKDSTKQFKEHASCVAKQYTRFHIENSNLTVNGDQTLGENIADNGGVKASYHAYLRWTRKNEKERHLPGIALNHKQLFFVSFAQIWCSKSNPETASHPTSSAVHSPHRFRVLGSMMNLKEFAEVFECPLSSPMNPIDKCGVW